jgi:acyl carrier protein
LAAPAESDTTRATALVAPSSPAERAIAEVWERLLSVEQVSVTDNFFDLGGHSLLAIKAASEMEKRLGAKIDMNRLIVESLGQLASDSGQIVPAEMSLGADPADLHAPKGFLQRVFSRFGRVPRA